MGKRAHHIGPFFQSYLKDSQGLKAPIAPKGRCNSVQMKDRGELWRTKGGCPIFRLPLAGSCTGHILQERTSNLSTTSLSPPTSYTEMAAILLIHWPELGNKEITPRCFQTQCWKFWKLFGCLQPQQQDSTGAERASSLSSQSVSSRLPRTDPSCHTVSSSFNQEILPYPMAESQLYFPLHAKLRPI